MDDIDFTALIEPVARELWGEPNKALSNSRELRWGTRGSRSINIKKGVWHDHETNEGGGTLDLVKRDADCAGFSGDETNTPRVCAPYKTTTWFSIDNAPNCLSDLDCAIACNSSTNNPNPGGVYGANAGIFGPNGKCREITWALECAPSLGGTKLGPGAACTRSSDCKTGHCLTPGNYCFGGCATDADCLNGTHCRSNTYLGMTNIFFCQP